MFFDNARDFDLWLFLCAEHHKSLTVIGSVAAPNSEVAMYGNPYNSSSLCEPNLNRNLIQPLRTQSANAPMHNICPCALGSNDFEYQTDLSLLADATQSSLGPPLMKKD